MSAKDLHKESFTEETITKLEIFEKYLESWLPVAIESPFIKEVNICDFFSGPGKSVDGVKGSPLRVISVINKYYDRIIEQKLQINILFNEYVKKKFNQLCDCIKLEQERLKRLESFLKIELFNEEFKGLFNSKKALLKNDFNLFFLDQSGVKHITEDVFLELIRFPKTDFMFFISSSSFKRFASDPSFQKHFSDINLQEISMTKQTEMHKLILQYYRGKIPRTSKVKLYPFTIKKGVNVYGLIFGTKHPLGVDKFLKIAWDTNELNGEANFDIDDDWEAKQGVLFGVRKLSKIERYEHELEKYIMSKKEISNIELFDYALEKGHIGAHTIEVLKRLKKNNKIEYEGHPCISYDKCYKKKELKHFKIKP
jgi:three-Cys-motif partner protein